MYTLLVFVKHNFLLTFWTVVPVDANGPFVRLYYSCMFGVPMPNHG
jgi:hypothetical protein